MEDILSASVVRVCQIHSIPALFNALAMHMLDMCTSQSLGQTLAKNRAQICMLGLRSLQDSWPVGGWVYKLFVYTIQQLQDRLEGRSSTIPSDGIAPPENALGNPAGLASNTRHGQPGTQNPAMSGLEEMLPSHSLSSAVQTTDTDTWITLNEFLRGIEDHGQFFDSLDIPNWDLQETN